MKLLVTGGHPSPAFALIEYLKAEEPHIDIFMIGRAVSLRTNNQPAWESTIAKQYGVPFYAIEAGRSRSRSVFHSISEFLLTIRSTIVALRILQKIKPDACISFGSYVAVPTVIAAWLLKLPILTHEQTHASGKSNRFIAKFARYVAISHQDSAAHFPVSKTIFTGLPLRPQLFENHPQPEWLYFNSQKPLLLVLGGSTGSYALNDVVIACCQELATQYVVIHQTGLPSNQADWLTVAKQKRDSLPEHIRGSYYPMATLSEAELAWIYPHTQKAISRSGANSTAELLAFDIPTLFVPLPTSAEGEQLKNAACACEQNHNNRILAQGDLQQNVLISMLNDMDNTHPKRKIASSLEPQRQLWKLINQMINNQSAFS